MVPLATIRLQILRINRQWPAFRPDNEAIEMLRALLENISESNFVASVNYFLELHNQFPPSAFQLADHADVLQSAQMPPLRPFSR